MTPPTTDPTGFALSPDGRHIVFVASNEGTSLLWVRSLDATTATPLSGTEGASSPFWSPDGRSVGFFTGGALKRVDLDGGSHSTLAAAPAAKGGTWGIGDIIVFAPLGDGPLMRVPATGGEAVPVQMDGPGLRRIGWPQFLPDGRRFVFWAQAMPSEAATAQGYENGIYFGALDGTAPKFLTLADASGVFGAPDWLFWVRAGELVARRLDLSVPEMLGDPISVAGAADFRIRNQSAVSVASTGTIAYRSGTAWQQVTWFDRSGTQQDVIGDAHAVLSSARVSPDGRQIVVSRPFGDINELDLWIINGTRESRFTYESSTEGSAVWSPDGDWIAYRSNRKGPFDLYRRLANGAGQDELVVASGVSKRPTSWSPDGRFLMYSTAGAETGNDLWVVPMNGLPRRTAGTPAEPATAEATPSVLLQTPFNETGGVFSPDGLWFAYESDDSGRMEVYIRPFVAPGDTDPRAGRIPVSDNGGLWPVWTGDGSELHYIDLEGDLVAVPITASGSGIEPGVPHVLFRTLLLSTGRSPGPDTPRNYDVGPDGRYLMSVPEYRAIGPITLVQHWQPESKP